KRRLFVPLSPRTTPVAGTPPPCRRQQPALLRLADQFPLVLLGHVPQHVRVTHHRPHSSVIPLLDLSSAGKGQLPSAAITYPGGDAMTQIPRRPARYTYDGRHHRQRPTASTDRPRVNCRWNSRNAITEGSRASSAAARSTPMPT